MSETSTAPSAEFVARASSRVRIYTTSGVLEGLHHHPPGVRLSDSLRNAATGERYLLLTEVSITHLDGTVSPSECVLVNTQHASVIIALD